MARTVEQQESVSSLGFITSASLQELEQAGLIDSTGWYGAIIRSASLYLHKHSGAPFLSRPAQPVEYLDRAKIIGYGALEAQGASVLRSISRSVTDPILRSDLQSHAYDEARHARLYFECLRERLTKDERVQVAARLRTH